MRLLLEENQFDEHKEKNDALRDDLVVDSQRDFTKNAVMINSLPIASDGTIVLDVKNPGLYMESIEVAGQMLKLKSEFHITIIGKKLAAKIMKMSTRDPELLSRIHKLFYTIDWSYQILDSAYLVEEKTGKQRKSIIKEAYCPGMYVFYEKLKLILNTPSILEMPFTHVTIYTDMNHPSGIGIESQEFLSGLEVTPLHSSLHI